MAHLKELEDENLRPKKMCAEVRLKAEVYSRPWQKNTEVISPPRDGTTGARLKSPAQVWEVVDSHLRDALTELSRLKASDIGKG